MHEVVCAGAPGHRTLTRNHAAGVGGGGGGGDSNAQNAPAQCSAPIHTVEAIRWRGKRRRRPSIGTDLQRGQMGGRPKVAGRGDLDLDPTGLLYNRKSHTQLDCERQTSQGVAR